MEAGVRLGGRIVGEAYAERVEDITWYLEPGYLYEAVVEVKGVYKGSRAVYEVVKKLWERYPGVYVNYVSIEGGPDTYTVTVQFFDPGYAAGPVAVAAILALILAILFVSWMVVNTVIRLVEVVPEAIRKIPPATRAAFNAALFAAALALAAYAVSRLRRVQR